MADQSVRACHPSKFYYFRRSPLISCCYAPSPLLPARLLHCSPPQPPIILPFRPFFLFSSPNPLPLCLPFRHDSPRPLPLPLVSSLFRSGFTLWPGPLFDTRREHEKKMRDSERALPACYVDERNKTAMESRARLFWFRGAASSRRLTL